MKHNKFDVEVLPKLLMEIEKYYKKIIEKNIINIFS